jgi:hypothetical protein
MASHVSEGDFTIDLKSCVAVSAGPVDQEERVAPTSPTGPAARVASAGHQHGVDHVDHAV